MAIKLEQMMPWVKDCLRKFREDYAAGKISQREYERVYPPSREWDPDRIARLDRHKARMEAKKASRAQR